MNTYRLNVVNPPGSTFSAIVNGKSTGHSVLLFRALSAYRDARAIALRNTIAALMREQRRAVNTTELT